MKESAVRIYPSTPESVEYVKHFLLKNEVHIVLAFARDYDAKGSTNGKFVPYFNPNFTPEWIREFKNISPKIKVYLSIGGRNEKYPFYVPSCDRDVWVTNAIDSLKHIVNNYGFDGIDVYYEHVAPGKDHDFVKAIGEVISVLKSSNERVMHIASLNVSAPLNSLYEALYNENPAMFDHVVYQIHSMPTPNNSTVDQLVQVFDRLKTTYTNSKLFAGHSFLPSDWKKVPRPIFLSAIPMLEKGIAGLSEWSVIDHDPES